MSREDADIMALTYLAKVPFDRVGRIETEAQFAAALIYLDLRDRGLALHTIDGDEGGPRISITNTGRAYLAAQKTEGR